MGFVANQVGSIGYVAFSGTLFVSGSDPSFKNLVRLPVRDVDGKYLFVPLHGKNEEEEPVLVQGALLRIFENMYSNPSFQNQVSFLPWRSSLIYVVLINYMLFGCKENERKYECS